ncbi:MAG: hypothetical protein WCO00_10660 [Rhodospirillaceae bacterium]
MVMTRRISESEIKGAKVKKNLNISRALFSIIFETIRESLNERDVLTIEDIARIEKKFDESWFHVESLFDNTCSQCTEAPWYVRDERRKDAVTRLVYARLLIAIEKRETPSGALFPRILVPGLQTMIAIMLTNREWRVLNEHARFIFEYIGSDDDGVLGAQLKQNQAMQLLCQRIFLTLLLRFKGFNNRRQEFMRVVTSGAAGSGYRMTDLEFCDVFEALFRDYHDMIQSEDGRLRLSISHSEDFPERIKGIFDAYFRYKTGVVFVNKFPVSALVR